MAHRYCQPRRGFLAITYGLSGSGKSTVAARLVEASGAIRLRSDVERKRLFGLAPEQHSRPDDAATLYSSDMSRRTFQRLAELAEVILVAGFPVIVDATFLHRRVRDDFRQLATRLDVPFAIIHCVADAPTLRDRLLRRAATGGDASEADIEVLAQQMEKMQPLTQAEMERAVAVDSGSAADELWAGLQPLLMQP